MTVSVMLCDFSLTLLYVRLAEPSSHSSSSKAVCFNLDVKVSHLRLHQS